MNRYRVQDGCWNCDTGWIVFEETGFDASRTCKCDEDGRKDYGICDDWESDSGDVAIKPNSVDTTLEK